MDGRQDSLRTLKWVSGGLEAMLGIPIFGGLIVFGTGYNALWLMLAFHIVVVVLTARAGRVSKGNIVGIVASTVGVIPFVGMLLHMAAAITILLDAAFGSRILTRTHVQRVEPIRPRPVRKEQERKEDHPF